MDDVHESLLDGEVRGEAAFVHAYVLAHEVERGAVMPAHSTAVHEGSRVRPQVALDGGAAAEELVAHLALVGLFSGVDPPVVVEFTGVGKPLPADLAAVLAVARLVLQCQVFAQELLRQLPLLQALLLETLSKAGSDVQAAPALVLADVVAIRRFQLEALATEVAAEKSLLHVLVNGQVLLQEVPIHEAAGTDRAGEDRDAQVRQGVPHQAAEAEVPLVTHAAHLAFQVDVVQDVAADSVEIFGQRLPAGSARQLGGRPSPKHGDLPRQQVAGVDDDVVVEDPFSSVEGQLPLGEELGLAHVTGEEKDADVGQNVSDPGVPVLEVGFADLAVPGEQIDVISRVLADQLDVGLQDLLAHLAGHGLAIPAVVLKGQLFLTVVAQLNNLFRWAQLFTGIFEMQFVLAQILQLKLIHLPKTLLFGVIAVAGTGVAPRGDVQGRISSEEATLAIVTIALDLILVAGACSGLNNDVHTAQAGLCRHTRSRSELPLI